LVEVPSLLVAIYCCFQGAYVGGLRIHGPHEGLQNVNAAHMETFIQEGQVRPGRSRALGKHGLYLKRLERFRFLPGAAGRKATDAAKQH
jgi:hypothetical protein